MHRTKSTPYFFFFFFFDNSFRSDIHSMSHSGSILWLLQFQHDIKIWSSFNHPHVCMTSFSRGKQMLKTIKMVVLDPPPPRHKTVETFFKISEKSKSYKFGSIWGWVNDDTIFIFGWTIPLNCDYLRVTSNFCTWQPFICGTFVD